MFLFQDLHIKNKFNKFFFSIFLTKFILTICNIGILQLSILMTISFVITNFKL